MTTHEPEVELSAKGLKWRAAQRRNEHWRIFLEAAFHCEAELLVDDFEPQTDWLEPISEEDQYTRKKKLAELTARLTALEVALRTVWEIKAGLRLTDKGRVAYARHVTDQLLVAALWVQEIDDL